MGDPMTKKMNFFSSKVCKLLIKDTTKITTSPSESSFFVPNSLAHLNFHIFEQFTKAPPIQK
jgi:hypothetical protein